MTKPFAINLLLLLFVSEGAVQTARATKGSRRQLAFGIPTEGIGRRDALTRTGQALAGGLGVLLNGPDKSFADDDAGRRASTKMDQSKPSPVSGDLRFDVYSITPDASEYLDPRLETLNKADFVRTLVDTTISKGGSIWLGEHHNSVKDHMMQADIIRNIYEARKEDGQPSLPMAIGLEQVQVQFQPALDDYLAGVNTEQELKERVQWETRWSWPFDAYRPVFETAKELGIRLLALNVDSEDLSQVEKGGFPGLEKARTQKYITDPYGFADFTKPPQFRAYVDYVIRPSFDLHQSMGLLQYTVSGQQLENDMPFVNFLSGRILWDEAMASAAHDWTQDNPGGLLIGLVGADHVKFEAGIPGRFSRMARGSRECKTVILNPTLIDTRPSGSVMNVVDSASSHYPERLTLQLRYLKEGVDVASAEERASSESTGGVLAFADYIVVGP